MEPRASCMLVKHPACQTTSPTPDPTKLKTYSSASSRPTSLLMSFNKRRRWWRRRPFSITHSPRNYRETVWIQALNSALLHPHPFTVCGPSKFSSRGSVFHGYVSVECCLPGLLRLDAGGGNAFSRFKVTCSFRLFVMDPGFVWLEHVSWLTSSAVQGEATALPKPLRVVERNSRLFCRVHLCGLTWILVTLTQFHTSYFIRVVLVRGGHGTWAARISNQWLACQAGDSGLFGSAVKQTGCSELCTPCTLLPCAKDTRATLRNP